MLHATPRGLFTWGFTVRQCGDTIADIDPSWLGERAEIRVEGQSYSAYRESLLAGTFVLQSEERTLLAGTFVLQSEMTLSSGAQ
jgi:hypothetical protein